jgi:tetratricopeptide (TPR) repeat protein
VAKYNKKRVRELQHDRFRDTTMNLFDRLANSLEGKGRQILYGLGGVLVLAIIIVVFVRWNARKNDEAAQALGRAITLSISPVTPTPGLNTSGVSFTSEKERAQRAIDEFEKVAVKYGDPYRSEARYFIASNRLAVDRPKAIGELNELANNSQPEVAALAKFALAQTKESDAKYDEAAQMYVALAKLNSPAVTPETANLRLAKVYDKQGKKKEAADLLFSIVETARKAKGKDDKPIPSSSAAREAATELQKLDPARYAQLPPEASILS